MSLKTRPSVRLRPPTFLDNQTKFMKRAACLTIWHIRIWYTLGFWPRAWTKLIPPRFLKVWFLQMWTRCTLKISLWWSLSLCWIELELFPVKRLLRMKFWERVSWCSRLPSDGTDGRLLLRALILFSPLMSGLIRSTVLSAFPKLPINGWLSSAKQGFSGVLLFGMKASDGRSSHTRAIPFLCSPLAFDTPLEASPFLETLELTVPFGQRPPIISELVPNSWLAGFWNTLTSFTTPVNKVVDIRELLVPLWFTNMAVKFTTLVSLWSTTSMLVGVTRSLCVTFTPATAVIAMAPMKSLLVSDGKLNPKSGYVPSIKKISLVTCTEEETPADGTSTRPKSPSPLSVVVSTTVQT